MQTSLTIIFTLSIVVALLFFYKVKSIKNSSEFIKKYDFNIKTYLILNTLLVAFVFNNNLNSDITSFESVLYTLSSPWSFVMTFLTLIVLYSVASSLSFVILKKVDKIDKYDILKLNRVMLVSLSLALTLFTYFLMSPSIVVNTKYSKSEQVYYSYKEHPTYENLERICPNGVRIKAGFFSYSVTCYEKNLSAKTIKFDYYSSRRDDYFSALSRKEESIVDAMHDITITNYDSNKTYVRMHMINDGMSKNDLIDTIRVFLSNADTVMGSVITWDEEIVRD